MAPGTNFNPFSTKKSFVDNEHDSDVNFYHNTQYLAPDKFKTNFKDFSKKKFCLEIKYQKYK